MSDSVLYILIALVGIGGFVGLFFIIASIDSDRKSQDEERKKRQNIWITENGLSDAKLLHNNGFCIGISFQKKILFIDFMQYSFDQILSCELVTETNSVTTTTGSISRAIVGGLVAGGVGALVGANSADKKTKVTSEIVGVKIYFDDGNQPSRTLTLPSETAVALYDSLRIVFLQQQKESKSIPPSDVSFIESGSFCPKCGVAVQEGDLFCRRCGNRLSK